MKHILITALAILWAATQLMAQDLIVPKKGNPITAYNIDAGGSFIYYTAESDANAALQRIAKDSVLMVRKADGTVMDFAAASATSQTSQAAMEKPKTDYPVIDEADIHGCYIAQGNKVFIPTDSPYDYEKAGQERLKELVEQWDYWTVVDSPEQAHFILQFTTQIEGRDMSWLLIRPREFYRVSHNVSRDNFTGAWRQKVGITAMYCYGNEDVENNRQMAVKLFNGLKRALTEPSSTESERFFRYHGDYLDADAKKKDHAGVVVDCDR